MTPTYEGRQYTDPDDLLVDQGLQFDIATLMNRRGLLHLLGVGAGTVALAACAPTASSETTPTAASSASAASAELTEIPEETAGPYPGDGSNGADVLEQSGVVRSDIRSSFGTSTTTAEGVPMTLELTVLDLAGGGAGFAGVAVYVWHCTRDGGYSMYSEGLTGENFLRGVQIADADGKVSFTSIFPGCYSGRWPHIHFEVYPDEASITDTANKLATSQVALPEAVCRDVYAMDGYAGSIMRSQPSGSLWGRDRPPTRAPPRRCPRQPLPNRAMTTNPTTASRRTGRKESVSFRIDQVLVRRAGTHDGVARLTVGEERAVGVLLQRDDVGAAGVGDLPALWNVATEPVDDGGDHVAGMAVGQPACLA